jgi:hypothetical protein
MLRGESPASHCKYARFLAVMQLIHRIYRVEGIILTLRLMTT